MNINIYFRIIFINSFLEISSETEGNSNVISHQRKLEILKNMKEHQGKRYLFRLGDDL